MRKGASVRAACEEAAEDLRDLKGGFLGPVLIHAVDRNGESSVVGVGEFKEPQVYHLWTEATQQAEKLDPSFVPF
jgi:L-asparaginase